MTNLIIPPPIEKFLNEVTRKHAPEAKIVLKSESKLMRVIAWLVKPFNPNFLNTYITTIGTTIYVPDNYFESGDITGALSVVAHETQHMIDSKKWGMLLFGAGYLFPQILALFSLLAFLAIPFSGWWLLALLCLGFAVPIPAWFRYRIELNGYRTSTIFSKYVWRYDALGMNQMDNIVVQQLTSKWYYFAWPFPKEVKKDIQQPLGLWITEPRYEELMRWLIDNGYATILSTPKETMTSTALKKLMIQNILVPPSNNSKNWN